MPVRKYQSDFMDFVDSIPLATPREMFSRLGKQGYIGQESARRAICLMAYRHISRIKKIYVLGIDRGLLPVKENILLIGPTGCGKTYLIELLFQKILKIPAVIIDITSYSETGYVGQDVPTILTKLLFASKNLPELATVGIVCIDEFDKIASGKNTAVFSGQGTTKDVTGYGVQRELLKMLEAGEIDVPGELSHTTYSPRIVMNTQDIPFIACGAFTGFKDAVRNSASNNYAHGTGIGFRKGKHESFSHRITSSLSREEVEKAASFESYGILPELIGRFSRIVPFDALDESTLKEILRKNTVEKYARELSLDGIGLQIEENVYDEIVNRCLKKETGARGLGALLTEILEDACFDAYSAVVKKKKISVKCIDGNIETSLIDK